MKSSEKEIVIPGIPVSPGIAIGTALVFRGIDIRVDERSISKEKVDSEINRLYNALNKTRLQILDLQNRVQNTLTEKDSRIFDAQLLIVDDKMLMDEVETAVRRELKNVDFLFHKIIRRFITAIVTMDDAYFRERAADIEDVASRIIKNLQGAEENMLDHLPGQRIIVAYELTPSDTAILDKENVQAFATESGSRTSHTAIMARSMQIPAVVGTQKPLLNTISNDSLVIIDGYTGTIIVNPTAGTLSLYAEREVKGEKLYFDMLKESRLRPETLDGFRVQLAANIEHPEDIEEAKRYRASGIGLFRTEYLFINTQRIPSEEKQFSIYRSVASGMRGQPVIIRTLDLGGDKLSDIITPHYEANPFLGCRAIRLLLQQRDIFKTQLRAIIRAGAFGNVKLMFPMVSCSEEVDQLKDLVDEVKEELKKKKLPYDDKIKIGVMIETPAAAIIAESLAPKVDFFSIGTNDLVQYTLAVDRTNEKVAYLYQPTHPAILALINNVISAAKKHKIWVSVCGEMAGDPRYTPLLVGMGVHELSMSPISMGPIRRLIRRLKMHEAEEAAEKAMRCDNAKEALQISEALLYQTAPDILTMMFKEE